MNRAVARIATLLTATAATLTLAGTATATAASSQVVFRGEAEITLRSYGYCGSGGQPVPIAEGTATAPVTLVVGDPADDGTGGRETNDLHVTLQTDEQASPGAWAITTGLVATTPQSGRPVAVQYWGLAYDGSTGEISGTLQEDHAEEALVYNGLAVARLLIPCRPNMGTIPMIAAMAEGAQLQGILTRTGAKFAIAGRSSDGLYEFRIHTGTLRPVRQV
ncbi:MAG: hypothetical protein L0H84_05455 [Pseudonocardia sp.]|nr:hypothetical protein [Pseudonocardia sp.]